MERFSYMAGTVTQKTLKQLLSGLDATVETGVDALVSGIAYRSDAVRPGDLFFCVRGLVHDGHDFAREAVSRGAVAVVCDRPVETAAPQVLVPDVRHAMAVLSARLFDEPTRSMDVVGITGTNGKTTTTYLLDSIFRAAGRITGLIGTVETRIGDERLPSSRTTPESADLQRLFARMRDAGVTGVSMEVSSHAIDLRRVDGVCFAAAAFTNLTQDHLDYHATIEEYWQVKRRLFTGHDVRQRIINIDDPRGAELSEGATGAWTVGRRSSAIVRATEEVPDQQATEFTLVTPRGTARMRLPLAGAYNVSNALVAAASALAIDVPLDAVISGLESAPQVPGRLERIDEGQPFSVLVDYAHTPDSLEKAVAAVREVTPGRLITVFGCGGDRDPAKRPLMGQAAGSGSDHVVVTSDNPRSEDPVEIIASIEDGLKDAGASYSVEIDRRSAIHEALCLAQPGDSVLIAGKGHEDYQIFSDRTIHFDDREVAREELRGQC